MFARNFAFLIIKSLAKSAFASLIILTIFFAYTNNVKYKINKFF